MHVFKTRYIEQLYKCNQMQTATVLRLETLVEPSFERNSRLKLSHTCYKFKMEGTSHLSQSQCFHLKFLFPLKHKRYSCSKMLQDQQESRTFISCDKTGVFKIYFSENHRTKK